MEKIIAYCLVNLFTWNPNKSMEIVREFLIDKQTSVKNPLIKTQKVENKEKESVTNKKIELQKSLDYLKSKQSKTKQDKESIYTLEMVLKNMK